VTGLSPSRLAEVCGFLNEAHARYLVVGGFACALHGVIRATKDVDLLIPEDLDNARRVHAALCRLPLHLAEEFEPEEFISKPFTIIGDWTRVDVLTRAGATRFEDLWGDHLTAEIDGVRVPYPSLGGLIRTKDTDRLQDRADAERLAEVLRASPDG